MRRPELPLVIHPSNSEVSIGQILEHMTAGDELTHAYRGHPEGTLDENGRFRREVMAAAHRGVLFDAGHDKGSFSWGVAKRSIAQGFAANKISSDLHVCNLPGPVFDLATTAVKLVHLGLSRRGTGLGDAPVSPSDGDLGRRRRAEDRDGRRWRGTRAQEGSYALFDSADVERTARQRLV